MGRLRLERERLESKSIIDKQNFTLTDTQNLGEFFKINKSKEFIQKVIDNKIGFDIDSLIYMMQINTKNRATETPNITSLDNIDTNNKYKDIITIIEDDKKLYVVGDIHADQTSLTQILKKTGFYENYEDVKLLFLGDYVDRGVNRLGVINLLIVLEFLVPHNILILKGNHELYVIDENGTLQSPMLGSDNMSYFFTFLNNMSKKPEYSSMFSKEFIEAYADYFDNLPIIALLNSEKIKIMGVHGGLPRANLNMDNYYDNYESFNDFLDADKEDMLGMNLKNNLLWADPYDGTIEGYRNTSLSRFQFNKEHFVSFCKKFQVDMILRAHEAHNQGYKTYYDQRLISVFSSGGKDIKNNVNENSYYKDVTPNILEIDFQDNSIKSLEIFFNDDDMIVENKFLFQEIKDNRTLQEQEYKDYKVITKNIQMKQKCSACKMLVLKDKFNKSKIKTISTAQKDQIILNYSSLKDFYGIHRKLEFIIDLQNNIIKNISEIDIYIDRFILKQGECLPFYSGEYRFESGGMLFLECA